jgi:hypothetical protein
VKLPTGKELDAVYSAAFREARDRNRDPTPAHYDALTAVVNEVAPYIREQAKEAAGE